MFPRHTIQIDPETGSDHASQLQNCLTQIQNTENILKQTVFIQADNNQDFFTLRSELHAQLQDFFGLQIPPTCFIAQEPENTLLALELTITHEELEKIVFQRNKIENLTYYAVTCQEHKEVFAAGLSGSESISGTAEQSHFAFGQMKRILQAEGLFPHNIVRQWNYIPRITAVNTEENDLKQHYQVFNDIRTVVYGNHDFKQGYPAATGIGTNLGNVTIDFTAVSGSDKLKITPLSNPRQIDAHRYSQEVLIGRSIAEIAQKGSPKFERAKVITAGDSGLIYISGTAAIVGQKTESAQDAAAQTLTTLENISLLISADNLAENNIQVAQDPHPSYIRVYVKNKTDIPAVKKVCQDFLGDIPALYVVADICREDLLVEIEGEAAIKLLTP